jgi:hypothetical protein
MTTKKQDERGLGVRKSIKRSDFRQGVWHVKSESQPDVEYRVLYESATCACTCTAFRLHQPEWCKHIWAVHEFVSENTDMAPIGPRPAPVGRYRDWAEYHRSRAWQIEQVETLMAELCRPMTTPSASPKGGRPRNPVADVVYTLVLRAYCNFPGRRFPRLLSSILEHALTKGAITRVPGASSAQSCLGEGWMESLLTELILSTSFPFRSLETIIAVDCSGFLGSRRQNYTKRKTGGKGRERGWKRAHIMCGVRTGIITAAIVTDAHDHDSPLLPPLLEMTCQRFKVKEVLGDSAYASARNFDAILAKGAKPYINFRKNAKGAKPGAWRETFLYYRDHHAEWQEHYRRRRMVEAVWSATKRMFGERLRSKGDVAAQNELLLKLLCYNLCCLIRCIHEFGIEPEFTNGSMNGQNGWRIQHPE